MVDTILKFRRGLAREWVATNHLLQSGEPGYEEDTNKYKVGDGIRRWNDLPYFGETDPLHGITRQDLTDHVESLTPHPVYDDGPSFLLLYENAKV